MLVVCNYLSPLFSQNFIFPLDNSNSSAYDEHTSRYRRGLSHGKSGGSGWEVSIINKQKFLAELAKLLTFMYEEDRQRALAAYSDMFEEAEDEQALLQALVSPLRQAVEVARAYNSGKQSLSTESKPREGDEVNDAFMETIQRIRDEALPEKKLPPEVDEDQISLFDAAEEPRQPQPAEPAAEEAEPAEAADEEAEAETEPDEETEASEEEAEESEEEDEEEEEEPENAPKPIRRDAAPERIFPTAEEEAMRPAPRKTVRKARVPLLILYLIFAVPLGLIATLVLLIPAMASLAAAVACIVVAVLAISSSLVSFPKIANLLVALGAALILLAVGLVFLMLFVWFLGGAIGGVINGLVNLGSKWCFKEVPAE